MQSLESSLFVVDESAAAVSGIKSGGLHAAYPREKPSRAELIKWLEGGREYLGSIGYGPFLRKEDPYDLAKLAPISLETVSAAADAETKAAVATENRRITRENAKNKIEYDARKREIQNRLAARISIAMRMTAPIKLKDLKSKCGHFRQRARADLRRHHRSRNSALGSRVG